MLTHAEWKDRAARLNGLNAFVRPTIFAGAGDEARIVRDTVDAHSAMTPFGGVKQSGSGRDLSLHSFEKYSALKTVWVKY
jgi:acyl-CoA reductase-like NAD-dependent aldehyde dehydrogenase